MANRPGSNESSSGMHKSHVQQLVKCKRYTFVVILNRVLLWVQSEGKSLQEVSAVRARSADAGAARVANSVPRQMMTRTDSEETAQLQGLEAQLVAMMKKRRRAQPDTSTTPSTAAPAGTRAGLNVGTRCATEALVDKLLGELSEGEDSRPVGALGQKQKPPKLLCGIPHPQVPETAPALYHIAGLLVFQDPD